MKFKEVFKYPFKNFKPFWNIFWVLIPIFGWLFFYGYQLQVLESVIKSKYKKGLPPSKGFWENVRTGLRYLIHSLPLVIIVLIWATLTNNNSLVYTMGVLFISIPTVYLYAKYSLDHEFKSLYEYGKGYNFFFNDFKGWFIFIVMVFLVSVAWLAASILLVTIIITIPALIYSNLYLIGRYYNKFYKAEKLTHKLVNPSKEKKFGNATKQSVSVIKAVTSKRKSVKKESKRKSLKKTGVKKFVTSGSKQNKGSVKNKGSEKNFVQNKRKKNN